MKKLITRALIKECIDSLLNGNISYQTFGEEMFQYLAFDDEYEFESGYEDLIKEILGEFTEMHDIGKKNVGYIPQFPSIEGFNELKKRLE